MPYSYKSSKLAAAQPHPGTREIKWASPEQKEAFEYGPAPLCMSGGWGAGKTALAAFKAFFLMDTFPGYRILVGRTVWDDLKRTTMATFFKILPPHAYIHGGKRADSDKLLRLNNGSEIVWLHFDDPDVANVIKGIELNAYILDQAEDIDEQVFDDLNGRLNRWDKAVVPKWLLDKYAKYGVKWPWYYEGTTTPAPPSYSILTVNPDHLLHWVYRRFHPDSPDHWEPRSDKDGVQLGSYHDQGYHMVTMPSDSNKFLDKRVIVALSNRDESFQRRYRRGEWGITEGQIHTVSDFNLLDGTPELLEWIRSNCTLNRVLDHGDSAPTCCLWFAVDREGNVFFYREYYQPNRLISFHRQRIFELSRVEMGPPAIMEKYDYNLADPSIFFQGSQKNGFKFSISDEYEDCVNQPRSTAIFWMKGDNDEFGTRNRISEYLAFDPDRIHPVTRTKGSPRLFLIKRSSSFPHGCFQSLRELQSQKRVKIGTEAGRPTFSDERDEQVPDHSYDCIRYAIASRPPVAYEPSKQQGEFTWSSVHRQLQDFNRSGGRQLLASQARDQFLSQTRRPR